MSTGIQWTQAVWNPTTGCDRVSEGCDHCYALTMAKRLKGMGQAKYQLDGNPKTSGPGFGLAVHPDSLAVPLRWRKPRKVFVNSMSDLFHDAVPDRFIASVFGVMARAPQHTFQVLTKRHARMRSLLSNPDWVWSMQVDALRHGFNPDGVELNPQDIAWPLPNVWLGVSVEDQKWADIRVPALLKTPAAVRFLSCEPLLGPVKVPFVEEYDGCTCGTGPGGYYGMHERGCGTEPGPAWGNLHWVIAGGESGAGARPCELGWLRSLRHQCAEAGVPFFCKQLGAVLGRQFGAGPHGADWSAWPDDLRVREFPVAAEAVPA